MIHKIYNLIGIIATIALTIFATIKKINIMYILGYIFFAYIIIYIILNAILKEKLKAFLLYPLLGILIFIGISNMTIIGFNTISYALEIPQNIKSINELENSEEFEKLFSYKNETYYINKNKTSLIGIDEKSKYEGAFIIDVFKETDLSEEINSKLKLFTSFNSVKDLKNLSNKTLHYGLLNDVSSKSIIIRIIEENGDIYYTSFTPSNLKDFFNENSLFKNHLSKGDFNLYISSTLVEQEVTENNNIINAEFEQETENSSKEENSSINESNTEKQSIEDSNEETPVSKALTLTNNGYYFTDILFVQYQTDLSYQVRLNNFYNKNILTKINEIVINKETATETEMEKYEEEVKNLLTESEDHYVYLSDEIIKSQDETFRFYTVMDSQNTEGKTLTDINAIEIENNDQYILFKTEFDVNSLYSILYD